MSPGRMQALLLRDEAGEQSHVSPRLGTEMVLREAGAERSTAGSGAGCPGYERASLWVPGPSRIPGREGCGSGHSPYQPGWQMHCPQTKFPWKLHLGESNSCCCKREEALLNGPSCPQGHFRNQKGRSRGKVLP